MPTIMPCFNAPGVLVAFDSDKDRFSVVSTDTQCGYFVKRGDLVGDFRNHGEVLREILSGCNCEIDLLLDKSADEEINRLWEANIVLF